MDRNELTWFVTALEHTSDLYMESIAESSGCKRDKRRKLSEQHIDWKTIIHKFCLCVYESEKGSIFRLFMSLMQRTTILQLNLHKSILRSLFSSLIFQTVSKQCLIYITSELFWFMQEFDLTPPYTKTRC